MEHATLINNISDVLTFEQTLAPFFSIFAIKRKESQQQILFQFSIQELEELYLIYPKVH